MMVPQIGRVADTDRLPESLGWADPLATISI